ncbi:MAG: NAD(P)H-dependent oxidoreductase [Pseudomonadota bacterium]
MTQTILHIDASARYEGSITRQLSDRIAKKLGGTVTTRDLNAAIPHVDETWIGANFTLADDRTEDQRAALGLSDQLIAEIKAADVLVLGVPVYNFGVPASLKAWIDQIARAGVTFQYTENGPVGLLTGKRAIIALSTGGTPVGSNIDFASGYMKHIMGFIGITDVSVIAAERVMADAERAVNEANAQVDALAA